MCAVREKVRDGFDAHAEIPLRVDRMEGVRANRPNGCDVAHSGAKKDCARRRRSASDGATYQRGRDYIKGGQEH